MSIFCIYRKIYIFNSVNKDISVSHCYQPNYEHSGVQGSRQWMYPAVVVDILPHLKSGDSYGAHSSARLLWIASAGSCFVEAATRCPRAKILIAPTTSAFSSKSHCTQANSACVLRLSAWICPQAGHVRLVLCDGTAMSQPPALKGKVWRAPDQIITLFISYPLYDHSKHDWQQHPIGIKDKWIFYYE